MLKRLACLLLGVFANAAPAFAHVASAYHGSFLSGFSHPFFDLDHIVVMVAVGMWAVSVGGRAQWLIPTTFIGSMTAGYMLSIAGIDVPSVESMILVSVLAAGVAIAAPIRLPTVLGASLAGIFALCHGSAHGAELGTAESLPFGVGLAAAAAVLHAAGIGLGLLIGSGAHVGKGDGAAPFKWNGEG